MARPGAAPRGSNASFRMVALTDNSTVEIMIRHQIVKTW
jgi:hypothetical protein